MRHFTTRFQFNLKQLWLPTALCLGFLAYDVYFFVEFDPGRDVQGYIRDIRAINDYCNYYLVFISVLMGFLMTLPHDYAGRRSDVIPIAPFAVALIAASVNMVFIPIPYNHASVTAAQWLWFYHVVCEQIVVIFTAVGLVNLIRTFMKMHPVEPVEEETSQVS